MGAEVGLEKTLVDQKEGSKGLVSLESNGNSMGIITKVPRWSTTYLMDTAFLMRW